MITANDRHNVLFTLSSKQWLYLTRFSRYWW